MGIEAFKRLRETVPTARLLVICPLSLIESAWIEDIKKFAPELTTINLHDDPGFLARSGFVFDHLADIHIVNYDTFISKKFEPSLQSLVPVYGMLNKKVERASCEWMCILDESSKIKNHSAKTTKTILKSIPLFSYRIAMSATPAPNSELEYWPQVEFCVPGTLHRSFHGFKNTYFHLGRGKQIMQGAILGRAEYAKMFSSGWKYQITEEKKQVLMEKISSISFRCDKDLCLDLPDTMDEIRSVEMGAVQRKHYAQMKNDLITEIRGQAIVAQVALTKIMKLRQLTSGFAINPEGHAVPIGENPKLSELLSVLEECGDQQVIIWANFHEEIETICKALGDKARHVYSKTEDKDGAISGFKQGQYQYLVAHPRSAGHGHTFVNSAVEIFFSLDYSWEAYEQARGRVHRAGQTNKCTYIHLLCKDSIDEAILACLRRKADASELLFEALK